MAPIEALIHIRVEKGETNAPYSSMNYNAFLKDDNGVEFVASCGITIQLVANQWRVVINPTEVRQTQLGLAIVIYTSLIKKTIEMLPPPTL